MATPIVVSFLLAIPVLVTWVGKSVSKKANPAEQQRNQDEENAGPSAKAETTWSMGMRKLWTPTGTISCFGVFALCFPNILFTLVACSIDCKLLCFVYQTNMFSRFCATGFSSSIL